MAKATSAFTFNQHGDFGTNLISFGMHLAGIDGTLGAALSQRFTGLRDGTVSQTDLWTSLFQAVEAAKSATSQPTTSAPATATPAPSAAPATGHNAVSGWFLEGISIEGFRGINNEGKPLDLKFHLDKINSLSAVNGVGKSSVYDAIRYAISGKLNWLDELPASERDSDYYLNRFNTAKKATIKLKLVAEPTGQKCEIVVTRDSVGNRTATASGTWVAEDILRALDREFVLLDGPTFFNFITAKPLDRGRTFAGLLGLSDYNAMRQTLSGLANTRAFGNHFDMSAHAATRAHEEKAVADARDAIARDYVILTGQSLTTTKATEAVEHCHQGLAQIALLADLCKDKAFLDIEIDACLDAVKAAEGGPKRDRLQACIREREDLAKRNIDAPDAERRAQLAVLAAAREEAAGKTTGDVMLNLFQAGLKALELPEWQTPDQCPLCESRTPHDLKTHVSGKLANFTALDEATQAAAVEWNQAGWADLGKLEELLEPASEQRLIAKHEPQAKAGTLAKDDALRLATWVGDLRTRAAAKEAELAAEQLALEKDLPPSTVEVAKKIEAARRLQENWRKLGDANRSVKRETERDATVTQIKKFLDTTSADFASAEAQISKDRLAAVEPVFQANFARMSFPGVVPAVSKRASSEDLQIRLNEFHGLQNLSPQAVLSESFRNAFAISLYLAAASLYGGMPKFIVLDDVTSSFDAGHQLYLVELLRTTLARPANASGLQVILLSHDTMLEKLFNKHTTSGSWWHQRLEGVPQLGVHPQTGAVNKVKDQTIAMLQAGQVDFAKEGVRQYLEYRLSDLISRLRIPVPVDVAFNDNKQLASEFLNAIDAAVKLNHAANKLVLDATQVGGLNANMMTIVGNFLSHWGTGQTLSFTGASLIGVMQAIDAYCDCFTFEPLPGAPRQFYKTLQHRQ
ncbi:ATP-binding protein [Rhizobium leguminosarum]|uniref:ATP-binding protein n=1 Tax=Rhizobium leguminosarum TaxID=384 RepID=UPI001C922045|nr:ATP-binding protein [Rhizobium leguminosarum]MBY2985683.1 AAA family ATPase [Rhizobium leguminosarum]